MKYIKLFESDLSDFSLYLKILKKYIKILRTGNANQYDFAKKFFIILYNFLIIERGFHEYVFGNNSIHKYLYLEDLDKIEDIFAKFERLYDPINSMVRYNVDRLSDVEIIKQYLIDKPEVFNRLIDYNRTLKDIEMFISMKKYNL